MGDILHRILARFPGWDGIDQASFLRRMAHECFRAAKVLEERPSGAPEERITNVS